MDKRSPGSLVPPAQRQTLKAALLHALDDPDPNGAANAAIDGLAELRDPGDRERIQQIANSKTDAYSRRHASYILEHWGKAHCPVC